MGRDYDMKRIEVGAEASAEIVKFIRDWLQNFHDNYRAETTATQWALYEFINILNQKVGIGVCPCCGNEHGEREI